MKLSIWQSQLTTNHASSHAYGAALAMRIDIEFA